MTARELLAELGRCGIRLWAESGKLRFDAPKGALTDTLREQIKALRDELLTALADDPLAAPADIQLVCVSRDGALPLSFGQQRLWFLDQLAPDDLAYNVPATVRLRGALDAAAMGRALDEIVRRHETLRSHMPSVDGQATLVIEPPRSIGLTVERLDQELGELDAEGRAAEAARRALADARRPFDLAAGPLFRVRLFRLGADDHVLHVVMHHVISDGWSMGVFFRELSALYGAFLAGKPSPLPALPIQYADYAHWQQRALAGGALAEHLEWWRQQLQGDLPVLELPTDRPRRSMPSHAGAFLWFPLDSGLRDDLTQLAKREGATRFQVMLAAFYVLLARHTGQDDLVTGTPIAGRARAEIEGLIGFFVNNLVLRGDVSGDPTFRELIGRVRSMVLDAFAHQDTPFEKIVEAVSPERELGRNPLFQVLFNHFDLSDLGYDLPPLQMTTVDMTLDVSKFDLTLHCFEKDGLLVVKLEYDTDLFDQATVAVLGEHFITLLRGVVAEPGARVSALPLLSDAERRQLLVDWNRATAPLPGAGSIHALFRAQAEATPDAPALVCEGQRLTFKQLAERSGALARRLVAAGVGPEGRVALLLDRSAEMIIGLLGVLEAGGAYVPIDPSTPPERVAWLLGDAGCRALLTRRATPEHAPPALPPLGDIVRLDVDDHAPAPDVALPNVGPGALAYVIYTSGSTGEPKGVEVEHRQVLDYLAGIVPRLDVPADSSYATVSTLAADLGNTSIFPALCGGGCLHVLSDERIGDGDAFAEWFAAHRIDVLKIVPSHLEALLAAAARPADVLPRKLLVLGGEACSWELVERVRALAPDCAVMNHYGPAETTVGVLTHRLAPGDRQRYPAAPPLGRPLANTRLYLVDRQGEPVPVGATGELWIAGGGVTRGYRNRPELTAKLFRRDVFRRSGEGRLYRSGDRARYTRDGVLHFAGRTDDQVKLRGYRVELGEVRAAVEGHPGVKTCAVVVDRDALGAARLVAYVVPTGSVDEFDVLALRRDLKARLPDHMVPATCMPLAALPLTKNGKLDRRALPAAGFDREALESEFVAPRTAAERSLAQIWCDVLRLERVGVHDNFFELGGESILSIQIISRANQAGLRLKPRDVFERATVAELAAVATAGGDDLPAAEQGAVTGAVPLTPIQRRYFELQPAEPAHYNHAVLLATARPLDADTLTAALAALELHHDVLRTRFTRDGAEWSQHIVAPSAPSGPSAAADAAPSEPASIEVVDLSALPAAEQRGALEARAQSVQASLDLGAGPLWRAVLFRLGDTDRLLIVVHHLVVDGVSWSVLLDDLRAAYERLVAGGEVVLPAKTTSFKAWADALMTRAADPDVLAEAATWTTAAHRDIPPLPTDRAEDRAGDRAEDRAEDRAGDAGVNLAGAAETLVVSLDAAETARLLREVPRAYRTQINDVLLTALARAAAPWTGSSKLLVDLEGHGREDEALGVDTSRTLGWFTSVHPVVLDAGAGSGAGSGADDDLGQALCAVKEQLRAIPGRGFDWGLLRYLAAPSPDIDALRALPAAAIGFNHMGQVDQAIEDTGLFARAPESPGVGTSLANRRRYLLDVGGSISGGRLHVSWTWCTALHERATIEALSARFVAELRGLIEHCAGPASGAGSGSGSARGVTLSDFPLAHLDADELQSIVERFGVERLEDIYVATPLQRGMLYHALAEPESVSYVTQLALTLHGDLSPADFRAAWQRALDANPVLRTGFVTEGLDEFHQVVCRDVPLRWDQQDWAALPGDIQAQRLEELARADREAGFDLADPPLMRLRLIALDPGPDGEPRHRLLWTHHHALLDGWSLPLLVKDVFTAYLSKGKQALPPRRPFVEAVRWIESQDREAAEEHWREVMDGWGEATPLPLATPGSEGAAPGERAMHGLRLSEATTAKLTALARREHVTLNTLVQGAWALLLARHADRDEALFGVTVSGRPPDLPGVETMLGLFINTLPLRVSVADQPLLPWLRTLQDQLIELQQFVATPLYEVQRLAAGRSSGRGAAPLFHSLVVFENYPVAVSEPVTTAGLRIGDAVDVSHATYPLALVAQPGARLSLQLRHDPARLDAGAAQRLVARLETLLEGMAAHPECHLSQLPLLSDDERRRQLEDWNDTARDYPRDASVPALFAARVAAAPDATALSCDGVTLTYAELQSRARKLARHLAARGIGPGARVAVRVERGVELVVAFLAILEAGAAYVPLDPEYPDRRVAFMLEDSGAALLITRAELADGLGDTSIDTLCLDTAATDIAAESDAPLDVELGGGDLAYIIYTSGSTGVPKGTCIPHRAIARLVLNTDYVQVRPGMRVAQASNASFDAATFEIWGALLNGGCLVGLSTELLLEPERLAAALRSERVDVLFVTTALFNKLVAQVPDIFATLECLLFGGEAVSPRWVRQLLQAGPPRRLLHVYGPTECTTYSTWHEVTGLTDDATTVPIGKPLAHSTAYVLDTHRGLTPVGATGELYLGGDGLALGYHERPELTAERFVPHPFVPGERLYRTGDLVVQQADGAVVFVGRGDHQVKLRGFRIELGEVEAAIRARPGIREVTVLLREDRPGDKQLVAYIVADEGAPGRGELREALGRDLPSYMIPGAMLFLPSLPLNANGKVDRARLPAPEGRQVEVEFVAPAPGLESEVAAVWCGVLGLDAVGAHDDFFELGGHSLLATQLLNRLGKQFAPVKLSLRMLFDNPTVAGLARVIDGARDGAEAESIPAAPTADGALPESVDGLSDDEVEELLRRLSEDPEPQP